MAAGALLAGPALAQDVLATSPEPRAANWATSYLELITRGIEAVGIGIIVLGALAASLFYLVQFARSRAGAYQAYRANLGRAILLGLEFLVAADIINTVAVDPTLQSLAVLAGIVLIRTFLSFSLEVEIEGRWPWQERRGRTG